MPRAALLAALLAAAGCVPVDPDPGATTIPAAAQGSWGMTSADCIPGRSDAKGLLQVGPTTLQFYESVGTLAAVATRSDTAIAGTFDFTGEGQSWQRQVSLSVEEGGTVLMRRDSDPATPAAGWRYTRCD